MSRNVLFLILVLLSVATLCFADFPNEGFEGTFPPAGWTNSGCERVTSADTAPHGGTYCIKLSGGHDYLISPLMASPGIIRYYHKKLTGNCFFSVQTSSSLSGPWTNALNYPMHANQGWSNPVQEVDLSALSNV